MQFSREQIETLKTTPITSYLHSLGFEPVNTAKGQLLYCSPLTGERSPSFFVHPEKNVFTCFSSGEKGDVIRLVTLIEKLAFKDVLERLSMFDRTKAVSFSFSGLNALNEQPQGSDQKPMLIEERALSHQALIRYVVSRGIPSELAKRYLCEVQYQNRNREYFAVGFKTDKDSYALRSQSFKGWIGEAGIRTIAVSGSTSVDVFEGFFDFLSALTFNRSFRPERTTIILNSTTNLKQALPTLQDTNSVNCYFDNDDGGKSTVAKLRTLSYRVVDCSGIYAGYNDFNDMIKDKGNGFP